MQNNELESMLKETENSKFEEWGNENLPYFEKLTTEEKEELRKSYEESKRYTAVWSSTMNAAIRNTGSPVDIDYTTDIDKSAANMNRANAGFESTINKLSDKYSNSKKM